jgi:hypothetical protein
MNEWLADLYGTSAADSQDLQKTAEAELLSKLAEDGDIDIDSLDDDEVVELATAMGLMEDEGPELSEEDAEKLAYIQKVAEHNDIDINSLSEDEFAQLVEFALSEDGDEAAEMTDGQKLAHITKVADANDIDLEQLTDEQFAELAAFALDPQLMEQAAAEEEEFESKFAEADFIGRVMAHAQFDEMRKISEIVEEDEFDKEAGRRLDALAALAGRARDRITGRAREAGGAVRQRAADATAGTRKKVKATADSASRRARGIDSAGGREATIRGEVGRKLTPSRLENWVASRAANKARILAPPSREGGGRIRRGIEKMDRGATRVESAVKERGARREAVEALRRRLGTGAITGSLGLAGLAGAVGAKTAGAGEIDELIEDRVLEVLTSLIDE